MGHVDTISHPYPPGHLFGLGLANDGTDATNDIVFAAGKARDSLDLVNLVTASSLIKRLDAAWAAGTNQGGRMSAAAITDTTYHCFIIGKPDGTTDVGFDTSPTAPTLPTGYVYFRRIGSILRESAAIAGFRQQGDHFTRVTTVNDHNSTSAFADALLTLRVPVGIRVRPHLNGTLVVGSVGLATMTVGDGDAASAHFLISRANLAGDTNLSTCNSVWTNTAAQIRLAVGVAGTITTGQLGLSGWDDPCGRLG
jgi:hypothetical protein